MRNVKATLLDYKDLVDSYVQGANDWRVKENSTVTYSVGGLILIELRRDHRELLAFSEIYDEEIADAHRSADYPPARPVHADGLLRRLVASSS